jgi:uracil-DNA glycosylase
MAYQDRHLEILEVDQPKRRASRGAAESSAPTPATRPVVPAANPVASLPARPVAAQTIVSPVSPVSQARTPPSVPVTAVPKVGASQSAKPADLAPDEAARRLVIARLGWDGLAGAIQDCRACVLCKERKQAVLGVGHREAPWLFVGEGPGADEDERGEPFVGQAGKLLDAMLAATGLARGREVYIANVVKCRPPTNRTPMPDEAAACAPFLDRQIELIQPKLIVALGKTAAMRMTGQDIAMGMMRGRVWRYRDIPLVVTYHPAYLLRSPGEKAKAWQDLVLAKRTMATLPETGEANSKK